MKEATASPKDDALKLALEALENHCGNYKLDDAGCKRWNKAVAAIKEALAQDELCSSQEPWMYRIWNDKDAQWRLTYDCSWPAEPIYTAPPAAQPEQGPSITKTGCGVLTLHSGFDDLPDGTKFYTTPPKRKWVGLTDEENLICLGFNKVLGLQYQEAKLKEKNT